MAKSSLTGPPRTWSTPTTLIYANIFPRLRLRRALFLRKPLLHLGQQFTATLALFHQAFDSRHKNTAGCRHHDGRALENIFASRHELAPEFTCPLWRPPLLRLAVLPAWPAR